MIAHSTVQYLVTMATVCFSQSSVVLGKRNGALNHLSLLLECTQLANHFLLALICALTMEIHFMAMHSTIPTV